MILQLNPPIPLRTPKGNGYAHLVLDYGVDFDLLWVVFLDEGGQCWTFSNREVTAQENISFGRSVGAFSVKTPEFVVEFKEGDTGRIVGGVISYRQENGHLILTLKDGQQLNYDLEKISGFKVNPPC